MLSLIIRRVLAVLPVMLLVSFGAFMLVALIPGDAAAAMAGGPNATAERIAEIRQEYGFDQPILVQYWDWLRGAVTLDFGRSVVSGQPVTEAIAQRLPITMALAFFALIFGVVVGSIIGVTAGMWSGTRYDRASVIAASAGLAIPNFWLAMILISVFSISLAWFPPGGYTPFGDSPTEWFRSLVLPTISLGLLAAATQARQLRASLMDVMRTSYVRTAWGKGGGSARVVGKHALKNAAMPAVTILGLQMGALVGGSVIIEQIFSIPGLGSYLLQSVLAFDVPVIQGVVLCFAFIQVLLMLLVDISYSLLNPKVRAA